MDRSLESGARSKFPLSLFRWPTQTDATEQTSIDWIAFPERVVTCLGRTPALRLLDVQDSRVGRDGRRLQEEYAEWRVVRSTRGIQQIEMTTETPEYWALLAAYAPDRALQILAEFAVEETVDASLVYGGLDPFSASSPEAREEAFVRAMSKGGSSPYNNGSKAIAFMVHPSNCMEALLELAVAATNALEFIEETDGVARCPDCRELAPLLEDRARWGRASDPLLVERLARLAFEGRQVVLDSPGPLAISGVENERLRTPSGEPVPREWFRLSRPMRLGARFQRLSFAVPSGEGYCISDLVDVATEDNITAGAQVADLVQITLYLLTTEERETRRKRIQVGAQGAANFCEDVIKLARELDPGESLA